MNDKLHGSVYCIINLVNNKKYVGQTIQSVNRRFKDHSAPSKSEKTYIARAIKKYGKDNFKVKILEKANSRNILNKLEIKWIKELNTLGPNGYNLTTGGEYFCHTDETKKRISEASKGKTAWTEGKKLSIEHRLNISKAKIGKKKTEKIINNMREARPNKKKIIDQNKNIYESIAEAGRLLGVLPSSIHNILKGIAQKTKKGCTFNYLGEEYVQ